MGQTTRLRSHGQKLCTHGKVLSLGILMRNIKALPFTVQKLLARLNKVSNGQKDYLNTNPYPPIFHTKRNPLIFWIQQVLTYLLLTLFHSHLYSNTFHRYTLYHGDHDRNVYCHSYYWTYTSYDREAILNKHITCIFIMLF